MKETKEKDEELTTRLIDAVDLLKNDGYTVSFIAKKANVTRAAIYRGISGKTQTTLPTVAAIERVVESCIGQETTFKRNLNEAKELLEKMIKEIESFQLKNFCLKI